MASTSRDATEMGMKIKIKQHKLVSFVPINAKTYLCGELIFDEDRKFKKEYKIVKMAKSCFPSITSSCTSRSRSSESLATGTSRQTPSRSPLETILRPLNELQIESTRAPEESQADSTSEHEQMDDETVEERSDDTKGETWTAYRSFLKVPQTNERPSSSRGRLDTVQEDYNPNQTNETWKCLALLSFDFAPDNLDESRVHTPSTDQAQGTQERSGSVAASTCADSTNINGIMSLVCYKEYLYAIGVLVKGVATTIVCRYPLRSVKKDGSRPRWEKLGSLPNRCPYHASCVFDGHILVIGGGDWNCNPETLMSITRFYGFKRSFWSKYGIYGDLTIPRKKHCVVAYAGNFIVVLGGENQHNEKLNCAEIAESALYNDVVRGEKFQPFAPMNHARSSFVAVHHSNFIYAIGGCEQEKRTGRITIERYSLKLNQWTDLEGFDSGMRLIFGFEHKQKICIVGGDPKTCDLPETKAEIKNPPPIVWKSPPAIDLPFADLHNSIATTTGIVKFKVRG